MMILSFSFFLFLVFYQGVDIFLFFVSFYFLYEIFFSLSLGYQSNIFFCGGWGYILCLLSIIIIMLMYWSGGLLKFFKSKYLFLLWFIFISLLFCFKMSDFLLFYLMFEFVVVPIFLLILMFGYSVDRVLASLYMFLYTLLTSLPFLGFLFYNEHSSSLNFIYMELVEKIEIFFGWWIFMALLVFMVKYPIYILHLWLSKAHVEAPVSGSMILAGVLLKLGAYGVLKLMILSGGFIIYFSALFSSLSMMGVVLLCFLMVRQLDVKIMVAYSSIIHMGPVMINFLYGFEFSLMSGNIMLLAHGLCSSALFYISNLSYDRCFSRSLLIVRGGLVLSPVISYWWFFLCVSNLGCPPTFNFVSEILMIWGLAYISYIFIIMICFLGFFVGVYCIYMYEYFNHGFVLSYSDFFSFFHLECTIIFMHGLPILLSVFFLGELV